MARLMIVFACILVDCSSHASLQFTDTEGDADATDTTLEDSSNIQGDATTLETSALSIQDSGTEIIHSDASQELDADAGLVEAEAEDITEVIIETDATNATDAGSEATASEAATAVICGGIQCAPGNGFERCCKNNQ